MKHIFLLFFLGIFFFSASVFASDEIQVSLSQQQVQVAEAFQIQIEINTEVFGSGEISLEIPGIENFEVFSQGQSSSFQSINGQTQSKLIYTLELSASKEGTFALGPIKAISPEKTLESDTTLSIVVGDNKQIILPSKQETISPEEKETSEDIKGLRTPSSFLWAWIFAGLALLTTFYLLLQYILKQQQKPETTKILSEEREVSKSQASIVFFENLGKKSHSLSSQEFFREYNTKLREIFTYQGITGAATKTLKELKEETGLKKSPLFTLFQKSYAYEYSSRDISLETRQKYIEDIISLL